MKNRFRSSSEHTLDGKGRLNFPSRFRDVLNQYDSKVLMVAPWGKSHLRAYPLSEWESFEDTLMTEGKRQKDVAKFMRYIVSSVVECSLDKQGRILLPQRLRDVANLDREVVLLGTINRVEIWNREVWEKENQDTSENFEAFDDQFAEMGIF
ncbi:division/cell wall cluster transcriptional repressor MraZ [Desulfosediminicola flagellatus]|uniref:division/cell wall cluster transcriptional repressor MraZ n=1 Tax=Desulfosediminicola flagellatus TaxID=2569541 RepID=UPI001E4474D5|nr:division/cell wall cluster transcriptional repressor MraZ [Desulfosediminicola flagellatus]